MIIKPYYAQHSDGSMEEGWSFWCPGCFDTHHYRTKAPDVPCSWREDKRWPVWAFNGNQRLPTFTPSLLLSSGGGHWVDGVWEEVAPKTTICHMYTTDGVFDFLGDCVHHLKGQKVPILSLPGDRAGQTLYRINHK